MDEKAEQLFKRRHDLIAQGRIRQDTPILDFRAC